MASRSSCLYSRQSFNVVNGFLKSGISSALDGTLSHFEDNDDEDHNMYSDEDDYYEYGLDDSVYQD